VFNREYCPNSIVQVPPVTAHDGAVWIHMGNQRVNIASHLFEKSKILMDAISSLDDPSIARDLSLDVPQEWLRAWVALFTSEDARLGNADIPELLNCLLVRFFPGALLLPC
jgi:hypothetical protein